jgi:hypothetical protein
MGVKTKKKRIPRTMGLIILPRANPKNIQRIFIGLNKIGLNRASIVNINEKNNKLRDINSDP